MGAWMLSCLLCSGMASGQATLTQEELREKALSAFHQKDWAVAHQQLSELLSVNGTDAELQMRYAVTLLHDGQMRPEGVQRLASLWEELEGSPSPELAFWWGRAWMLQGEGVEAQSWLKVALASAPKKAIWKQEAQVALAQSERLPEGFEWRQDLVKLDDFELPQASFHRYISWGREGTRLMATPEELQSKQDSKLGLYAPIAFSRSDGVLYHHGIDGKGTSGLDVFSADVAEEGGFLNHQRLPAPVNSEFDEKNPVWDANTRTLFFSSNRPGTMGGFDLFQTQWDGANWTDPEPLGPLFNSVHDDLAIYPGSETYSGWLVTNRGGVFGAPEVWEFELDGAPQRPVVLTTQWEVDGEVVPGTLVVYDAATAQPLASIDVTQEKGQWDLALASGQTIRYQFTGKDGLQVEGTYALPQTEEAGVVRQRMTMTHSNEATTLKASPLAQKVEAQSGLQWGWNLATAQPAHPEWRLWEPDDEPVLLAAELPAKERRLVKFQSYPWWTETQNEERAIAASLLSAYTPNWAMDPVPPKDFGSPSAWRMARQKQAQNVEDAAVEALLSLAAAEVLGQEAAWEEALSVAIDRAANAWPTGTLDLEAVARKAQRLWAAKGDLHDLGLLPEVKDKKGLLGDGGWVEVPWKSGQVAALGQLHQSLSSNASGTDLAWAISRQQAGDVDFWAPWAQTEAWDLGKAELELQALAELTFSAAADASPQGNALRGRNALEVEGLEAQLTQFLSSCRDRLMVLDAMEWPDTIDPDVQARTLGMWRALAITCSSVLEEHRGKVLASSNGGASETSEAVGMGTNVDGAGAEGGRVDRVEDMGQMVQDSWEELWERQTESVNPSLPWESAWLAWLEHHTGQTSDLSELAQRAQVDPRESSDLSRTGLLGVDGSDESPTMFPDWLTEAQEALELEWQGAQTPSLKSVELLRASWLLSHWGTDPDNGQKSPEEAVALQEEWPPSIMPILDRARVEWAQTLTREAQAQEFDPTSSADPAPEPPFQENDVLANAAVRDSISSGTGNKPESAQAQAGDMGLQLGWFRSAPDVQQLPLGTFLHSEIGKSGLQRWVLVFPQQQTKREGALEELLRWTVAQGIQDAYQVERGDQGWTRNRTAASSTQGQPAGRDPDAAGEADPKAVSDPAMSQEDPTSRDVAPKWLFGAPVELGNLVGTWYAVQVGAFRGLPKADWIDMAGEQLVFEKFEDGLARWYAGVRASREKASGRLAELKQLAPFQDAFLVQLSGGERLVLGPDEPVVQKEADPNATRNAPAQPSETEQEEMANPQAVTLPEMVRTETAASPQESPVKRKKTTPSTWHIDIARYFGRVPSGEVAVLLLRSRDWGVRSVEVMGQTTYFSRSFVDLAEAKAILEETFKEGFVDAVLVEEP